jgi:hypothetical protein
MIVEKTNTGFPVYNEGYPVITTGASFTELLSNSVEAMNLYLEDEGCMITGEKIHFEIDLKQFFK